MSARVKLASGLRERSPLCVGLDPDRALLPEIVRGDVAEFLCAIVEATAHVACAYKLNAAFFEVLGHAGHLALERVLRTIPASALTIWDAKRGDIENSNRQYARAAFETWGADAVTVHPYLGFEPLMPFFAYANRLTFVLCATSEGHRLQRLNIEGTQEPLWHWVAREAAAVDLQLGGGRLGLVVGATVASELAAVRQIAHALPLLCPGVGAQGGSWPSPPALVNVSRGILYRSRGADFAKAAAKAAEEYVHVRAA